MQILRIAIRQVWARPVRSLLSIVTLTLSMTALIVISAATDAISSVVRLSAIQLNGQPSTVVVSGFVGTVGLRHSDQLQSQLSLVYPASHLAVAARLESVIVEIDGVTMPVDATFVDEQFAHAYRYVVREGRWVANLDDTLVLDVVVNEAAKTQLAVRLGSPLSFRVPRSSAADPARVVGVVQDSQPNPRAYLSIRGGAHMLSANSASVSSTLVASGSEIDVHKVMQWVTLLGANFSSETLETQQTDSVGRLTAELNATGDAFRLIAAASLVTGIVGLANIGLATIREQSSELSLRRALGARWWHLPAVTMIEGQIVAVASAACAVTFSRAIYPLVTHQLGRNYGIVSAPFPWKLALFGLVISALAAGVASLAPALRSLRIPIATIMRAA